MPKRLRLLFACVGNSGRSQMAEAFARGIGGGSVEARSGGTRPLGYVLPVVIDAMAEKGLDLRTARSKGFDEEWIRRHCEIVVTMGCGDDACPAFVGKRMIDWDLPDPKDRSLEEVRRIRDDIERRVRALLRSEGVPGS